MVISVVLCTELCGCILRTIRLLAYFDMLLYIYTAAVTNSHIELWGMKAVKFCQLVLMSEQ